MKKTVLAIFTYIFIEMFFSMIAFVVIGDIVQDDIVIDKIFMPDMIHIGAIWVSIQVVVAMAYFYLLIKVFLNSNPFKDILRFFYSDLLLGFLIAIIMLLLICSIQIFLKNQSFELNHKLTGEVVWGLLVTFIVAIKEEIVFRGFVLNSLEKGIGKLKAIIISSLLFAIFHFFTIGFNFFVFLSALVLGFLLCAAFYKRNNIWFPIGIHFGWNFFLMFIYSVGEDLATEPYFKGTVLVNSFWTNLLEILVLTLFGFVFFQLFGKSLLKEVRILLKNN